MQWMGVALIIIGGYIITLKDIRRLYQPFTAIPLKYYLIVLAALLSWGIAPVISRIVLLEIETSSFIFFFMLFIFLMLSIVALSKRRHHQIVALVRKRWVLLSLSGIFWLSSDFLNMAAIAIPTAMVSLIMPVKRISNIFTLLIGGKIFKESNLIMKTIASIIMLAGLFMIGLSS